jgi:hypothetical protein
MAVHVCSDGTARRAKFDNKAASSAAAVMPVAGVPRHMRSGSNAQASSEAAGREGCRRARAMPTVPSPPTTSVTTATPCTPPGRAGHRRQPSATLHWPRIRARTLGGQRRSGGKRRSTPGEGDGPVEGRTTPLGQSEPGTSVPRQRSESDQLSGNQGSAWADVLGHAWTVKALLPASSPR